jgi:formate/nitrite transporter FocA (FNT family)
MIAEMQPSTGAISPATFMGNIVPATIGNLIGGSMVAIAYCWTYGPPETEG